MDNNHTEQLMKDIAFHAERLSLLMKDPQPGLISWGMQVGKHTQFIVD